MTNVNSMDDTAAWNSLPPAIINCDILSVFKSRLKTYLLNTAYS